LNGFFFERRERERERERKKDLVAIHGGNRSSKFTSTNLYTVCVTVLEQKLDLA